MKLGVISDTHGYLNPRVFSLFAGTDEILHAGDVGSPDILSDLRAIAPIRAVYGNTDKWDVRHETCEKLVLRYENLSIGLCHGAGDYSNIHERMYQLFLNDKVKIIIHGHSHTPVETWYRNVFVFNPGDGRKTLGLIDIEETGEFTSKIIPIE